MTHRHFYNRRIAVVSSGDRVRRYCSCGVLGPWTQHPNRQKPAVAETPKPKHTESSLLLKTKAELIELAMKTRDENGFMLTYKWNTKTTKDVMVSDLAAAYAV